MRLTICATLSILMGCASSRPATVTKVDRPAEGSTDNVSGAEQDSPTRYASRRPSERALKCALNAQSSGRPFKYDWHRVELPDVDMDYTLMAGASGERVLISSGDFGDELRTEFVGGCDKAQVIADGSLETENCRSGHPLLERLRIN